MHYLTSAYIVELLKLTAWHNKCYGMKKVLARQGIRITIRIVSILTQSCTYYSNLEVSMLYFIKSLVCDISCHLLLFYMVDSIFNFISFTQGPFLIK